MPLDGRTYDHDDVEVLIKARDGVANKWCQGTMRGSGGSRCAIGWIESIVGGNRAMEICDRHLLGLVSPLPFTCMSYHSMLYSHSVQSVMFFNDTHRQESVIALFDAAIANATVGAENAI